MLGVFGRHDWLRECRQLEYCISAAQVSSVVKGVICYNAEMAHPKVIYSSGHSVDRNGPLELVSFRL
jgi:hypothetical protein